MTATNMRALAASAVLALIVGVAGVASFAFAATGGPTVMLTSSTTASSTNAAIPVTATFSSAVTGLASSSVDVSNGTVSGFSGSGTTYTFTVTPTAEGAVTVMIPADAAIDASSTGNVASNELSFSYDATAPVISGVSVSGIGENGATVTWNTNEPTTGQVNFGLTSALGSSTTLETTASTTHSATISGLSASTTYTYQIAATDAAGNTATTSLATFDTTAASTSVAVPVISNIAVTSNGTSTATITWNTDVAATGNLSYGTTTAYGASSTLETTATTTHAVTLNNLAEATLYHFQISESTAGGTATSSDQTFFTQSTASSTPLAVTNVDTVRANASADNLYADGWEWVLHVTVPDNENAFRIRFSDWGNASSTFPAANNMRVYSTQSSNATSSDSAITETGNGYSDWLYLSGDSDPSTAGRQVNLVVDVKIPFGTANGSYTTTYTAQSYPSTATSTAH